MPRADILLKIYGHIWPASPALEAALRALLTEALPADAPLLERVGDMLRLSFEGLYFPVEALPAILQAHLEPVCQGRVDCLDLEAWTLTRHTLAQGCLGSRTVPLNHVLEHAGH